MMAGGRSSGVRSGDDADHIIIAAAYRELHDIACGKALAIVRSPDVAEDMVQDVWVKMLSGTAFDPDIGPFPAYFLKAVRNRCLTEIQGRRTVPASDDILEWVGSRYPDEGREHEEVLERIADLEARIGAALDVLELNGNQTAMLRMMIGPEPPSRPSAHSDGDRQARRRIRAQVEAKAGLTSDERRAVSLVRQHHDLRAAATAGGMEVQELQRRVASAERKILGLFNIPGED
jgi:DNA-directed RNA polymerase specialized sigma24 family protein